MVLHNISRCISEDSPKLKITYSNSENLLALLPGMPGGERLWVHPEAAKETGDPCGGQGGTALRGTEAEDSHSSGSCPQPQVIVMLLPHMGPALRGTEAEDSHSSGSCPQPQVIVMFLPHMGQGGTALRGTEAEDSHSSGSCPHPQVIVMFLPHMGQGGTALRGTEAEDSHSSGSCPQPHGDSYVPSSHGTRGPSSQGDRSRG
jgi:hypothetical protein